MSCKLLVKHFPSQMTPEQRIHFLRSFGAYAVHSFPDVGKMKYCCFATFYDENIATIAMRKLHQFNLLGTRLSAEYAKDDKNAVNQQPVEPNATINPEKEIEFRMKQQWNHLHFISPAFGLNYPFPPFLKYKYPKANKAIVKNICDALLENSRFYTQVLHLMNKMNLPPPFVGGLSDCHAEINNQAAVEVDTDSEIETDVDSMNNHLPLERDSFKRKRKTLDVGFVGMTERNKKVKSDNKNTKAVSVGISDLFENNTVQHKSTIVINVNDTLHLTQQQEVDVNVGGFGIIEPKKSGDIVTEANEPNIDKFISDDELRKNRLSLSELRNYSVFKNYEPGNKSCRLYIKNLDKKVEVDDLKRIFGRFVDWSSETERYSFNVCVLKEGRMKGQAFVTFSNENTAEKALKETNGLKLNGKPIIVAFARSAKVK